MRSCLLLHCLQVNCILAFPFFRDEIPNGREVPNPGPQGGIWAGVGHLRAAGSGARNPFGLDFAANGFTWTMELCQLDSDGDGRSNGMELGDPNCVWTPGTEPETAAFSHPGIPDEPAQMLPNDPCLTFEPPEDSVTLDVTFSSPNIVSATPRTQYVCEQMTIPTPNPTEFVFHQIKTQIIDNNPNVLHHTFIYVCDGIDSSDGNFVDQGAYECSGIEGNCYIIAGWALGAGDYCEPNNVGAFVDFGFGQLVFKVEAHYDNALAVEEVDQSGMRLHMTPTLRPLDSNVVILGMDYFDREFVIPQGRAEFALQSICPTTATSRLSQPIYAYSWNPHMHYFGTGLVTEHYRCGEKIGELGRIEAFEFDNQQTYYFDTPVKILPGDAIVTTCFFNSEESPSPILGGEETTDEMCDNYLTYYPYIGTNQEPDLFTMCVSYNQGLNPAYVGFNDFTPFVLLDLVGESVVYNYNSNPATNVAACCNNGGPEACEELYRAEMGEPCAQHRDCRGNSYQTMCYEGICSRPQRGRDRNNIRYQFGYSDP